GEDRAKEMEESFRQGGTGYGEYKKQLFEAVLDYFEPMRRRREELRKQPGLVEDILRKGTEKAREVAKSVILRVRQAVGI
ncbi:MAG: hypothetical protein NZL93_03250, partial [Chthoniobacterales bacterium]|nr:hypothetical protein [Chthoniobacterales bacterium]